VAAGHPANGLPCATGSEEPMSGQTTNEIAGFVTLTLLLALILVLLLR